MEFYVGLALKAKNERGGNADVLEDAFVIRTFKNGLGVSPSTELSVHILYARQTCFAGLGIEGLVLFKRDIQFDVETTQSLSTTSQSQYLIKVRRRVSTFSEASMSLVRLPVFFNIEGSPIALRTTYAVRTTFGTSTIKDAGW